MSHALRSKAGWVGAAALGWLCCANAGAEAARLYQRAGYQSPVRGGPDDLLPLYGVGIGADATVVYQIASAGESAAHPTAVPGESTSSIGIAPVVSRQTPFNLTVRLPATMTPNVAYRLWVVNASSEWSNAVNINDPRPLWFSPATAYATATTAGLTRYLKLVGRNLNAAPGPLRLSGRRTYELRDRAAGRDIDSLGYTVTRALPARVEPGDYQVQIQNSGGQWLDVAEQTLRVLPDPVPTREFPVSAAAFGGCRADDGQDDTACVAAALDAARRAGGGDVVFGRGSWDLDAVGLPVSTGVNLRGAGARLTRLVRHDAQQPRPHVAEFVLLGRNVVRDLEFTDSVASAPADEPRRVLQLGERYSTDERPDARAVAAADIVVTRNVFRRTNGALVDAGAPVKRLFITHNTFGDYRIGIDISGNRFNVHDRFGIEDVVIAHNTFKPGSYLDVKAGQGAMASELGASRRVDFSYNVADGSSREFLNAGADAPGFRAAFFWHMNDSHEMLLISANDISCSGDKAGDGEAISLDNNANTFALAASTKALAADQGSVTLAAPLKTEQNARRVPTADYYRGHWLRIDAGPGMGQSRRIADYRRDAEGRIRFAVQPDWDVAPQPDQSRVSIARVFWQTMIIANRVDQREPLCTKANRTRPKGGNISVWANSSDTIVADNRQYDSDGILFQQGYGADDASCDVCGAWTTLPAFLEIRDNRVEGEYRWDSSCSLSGIMGSFAAAPSQRSEPPPLSVGVSISHNLIVHADSLFGGAINIVPTWYRGPPGYAKALLQGISIHHNEIRDVAGRAPRTACNYPQGGRYGIHLQGGPNVEGTVLYRNSCIGVSTPIKDEAHRTVAVCDDPAPDSCECRHAP